MASDAKIAEFNEAYSEAPNDARWMLGPQYAGIQEGKLTDEQVGRITEELREMKRTGWSITPEMIKKAEVRFD